MRETTRIVRFMIIGTLNALITAVTIWIMMEVLKFGYLISNVVAYLLAQTHNFLWSKYWIFPLQENIFLEQGKSNRKNSAWKQVLFFSFAFASAYLGQFLFLIFIVELLKINEYLAQFLGLFVYGTINFVMNKKLTFR